MGIYAAIHRVPATDEDCQVAMASESPTPSNDWMRRELVTSLAGCFQGSDDEFIAFLGKVENYINGKGE